MATVEELLAEFGRFSPHAVQATVRPRGDDRRVSLFSVSTQIDPGTRECSTSSCTSIRASWRRRATPRSTWRRSRASAVARTRTRSPS